MSRIGILPVVIPKGIDINISDKNVITIKGPLGELKQTINPAISVEIVDNQVHVKRHTDQKAHKALHGLYRSLINNMVKGVSEGFTIVQELIGVGYKANAVGQQLELSLGYSHSIVIDLPTEIKIETVTERSKPPRIILKSHDKQLIGMVASKIRSLRKPEPYKGKGIKFQNEVLRRKAGKSAAAK
ncbi:MAG: 50S ribosomal protein L6 [Bacteroidales bacterium]|nr:50S ribosomal protein L6 [Bacteroidales bacterium]